MESVKINGIESLHENGMQEKGEELVHLRAMGEKEQQWDIEGGDEKKSPRVAASKLPQYTAAILATLGGFAMGLVLGWSAPAVEFMKQDNVTLSSSEISWIGSIANLGGAIVMLPMAFILDRFGRKTTMLGLAPLMVFGWLLLAFVHLVPVYIIGRFLTGMFGAAYSVAGPIYNGEIAEKDIRGKLGVFYQLFLCGGILFAYLIALFESLLVLTLVSTSIPIIFFVVFYFMPETPFYLLLKDKKAEAIKSLQWLRGKHYDIQDELKSIEDFVKQTKRNKMGFKDIFKSRPAVKALIISAGVMVCQQASGIKAVVFYSVSIFKESGSSVDPFVCTIIVGAVLTGATACSTLFVDNFGRRGLLLVGHVVTTLCLCSIGVYFYLKSIGHEIAETINLLPLIAMCLYLIFYTMGAGACSWVLLGELFPSEIKGMAGSFCASVNWFLAFVVTVSFPMLAATVGTAGAFWIFSGICLCGFIFVWFFVIETKGKTLEEIQKELSER